MHYPTSTLPSSLNDLIYFEYDANNQIIFRNGGIYDGNLDPSTGYKYRFSDKIYDKLTYEVNKIIIEKKSSSSDIEIPLFKRTFYLDQQNRVIQKIIETTSPSVKDTIDYEYNPSGKLVYLSSRNIYFPKESFFYYNDSMNLDSIVTKEYYDNASNPTKNLSFFEEIFNRSLSNNNYSIYDISIEKFDSGFNSRFLTGREWDFKYDDKGNILFDVY